MMHNSGVLGWWRAVLSFEECFALFGLSPYVDQRVVPSAFLFFCALTVHVIGLLFLRQCFFMLPPSTET